MEPDPKDIKRNIRSFYALYEMEGKRIDRFIESVAESMAYQQALVKAQRNLIKEFIKENRNAS